MSRIGKSPITVPDSVVLNISEKSIVAKGPKGELSLEIPDGISLKLENKILTLVRENDEQEGVITRSKRRKIGGKKIKKNISSKKTKKTKKSKKTKKCTKKLKKIKNK